MDYEIKLNDIADDLLILNKMTIDTLFRLDNCADCIALYIFYYKTAKWQKTNTIKANDLYVKKSLKWGADKIKRTKNILKEHGLINIIQRRKDGKIEGWYVEISYLVTKKRIEDVKIKVEENKNSQIGVVDTNNSYIKNSQNLEVEKSTSGNEDINALINNDNCFNDNNKVLKNNNRIDKEENLSINLSKEERENEILKNEFEELWLKYPKKEGKKRAFESYVKYRKSLGSDYVTKEDVEKGIDKYNRYIEENNVEDDFIKYGSTYFEKRGWEEIYFVPERVKVDTNNIKNEFLQRCTPALDLFYSKLASGERNDVEL